MKAAIIREHGSLDNILVGEIEDPKVGTTEVLIESHYAGLNHLDIFVTLGWPGLKLNMPHIIGADGSGIVKEVGDLVTNFSPGDRVLINPGMSCGKCEKCLSGNQNLCSKFSIKGEHFAGSFAEFITVPETNVIKIPDNFSLDKAAAAAPLAYLTAWRMLTTKAKVKYGDFVFVQGGSGGVSTCAIQIAKHFGATVITSTSSDEKGEKLKKLGADYVINYNSMPKYTSYVFKEITNRKGIDIAVDSVGKATFSSSIQMLKNGGKLVTCGATTGPDTHLNLSQVFWKQLEILGSTMSNQTEFRDVMELVLDGKLQVIIDKEFSLDNAGLAEKYLNEGKQFGKVILKIK